MTSRRDHRRPPWADGWRWEYDARRAARWRSSSHKAVALFLVFVQVFGTRAAAYGVNEPTLDRLGYVLLVAGPVALLWRDRWPPLALFGALAATTAYFARGYPAGPGFIAAVVAIFATLRAGHRLLTWLGVIAAFGTYAYFAVHTHALREIVVTGVLCFVVLCFAEGARVQGTRFAEIAKARAEQQRKARAEEERARKEQERRQASEERLLIARELHDVLGHHLSLINVQAGVGLHLMDERPEQARAALAAIKHASAEALRETRAVLAALNPRDESAPRAPTPGLADLDALVGEATAAGLPVTVHVEGRRRPLVAEVDRAAYRIVQEALTNVRRHAGPSAKAEICLTYRDDALAIDIVDDGLGSAASHVDGGNGIAGMRERAAALGGSVEAGPQEPSGFAVRAVLPIPEELP